MKETRLPISKRLNLDAALAQRISDYRFRERISSENEAIRRLLAAGLENAHSFFGKTPRWLLNAAKQELFAKSRVAPANLGDDSGPLAVAKRINLDDMTFARVKIYAELLGHPSENEAFRRLLLEGLDVAEGIDRGGEARAFLKAALYRQLAIIEERAASILYSEDPEEIWASAQEVFNEDGTLRAVLFEDGAEDGAKTE